MLIEVVGVLAAAALFAVFGLLWRGRGRGCSTPGGCASCGGDPDRRECGNGQR